MKRILKSFNSPIKGILDIILIMTVTILAVVFLGPIVIDSSFKEQNTGKIYSPEFEYTCEKTGRIIKDTLIDEHGKVYGFIDIEYYDNGMFKEIIETNERDLTIRHVYYSEEGKFLHWYEIEYDKNGNYKSIIKYDGVGNVIGKEE